MKTKSLNAFAVLLILLAGGLVAFRNVSWNEGQRILNVSYDPTRELYREIDATFAAQYAKDKHAKVSVEQSHGGSSRQARAVADGLAADVVTLALPSDIDGLARRGLIAADWRSRFPHESQPYTSTIVFVVRKGNPRHIKDWPDLAQPNLSIITPDPRTSGNGKLSFLAAWGSVLQRGGTEEQALEFVRQLYRNTPRLGQGARDSSTTFALAREGDVQLTWENEALREVEESRGELEIVYPPVSILAEPSVTWVDANVAAHQTKAIAQAYLGYLFTGAGQEIIAKDGYRPVDPQVLERHRDRLPPLTLFPITLLAKDWNEAQTKFFAENGVFDTIYPPKQP